MKLEEAIQWLDPDKRTPKIEEIENADGVDTADIVIQKFNEACRVVIDSLPKSDDDIINTIITECTRYTIEHKYHLKDVLKAVSIQLSAMAERMNN